MHFNDQQDNWVAEEIKNRFKNTNPPSKLESLPPSQKHSMMASRRVILLFNLKCFPVPATAFGSSFRFR